MTLFPKFSFRDNLALIGGLSAIGLIVGANLISPAQPLPRVVLMDEICLYQTAPLTEATRRRGELQYNQISNFEAVRIIDIVLSPADSEIWLGHTAQSLGCKIRVDASVPKDARFARPGEDAAKE